MLERSDRVGVALDPASLVIPEDSSGRHLLEFELLRKHSLRESLRARSELPDKLWAVENSLTIHQAKTYVCVSSSFLGFFFVC